MGSLIFPSKVFKYGKIDDSLDVIPQDGTEQELFFLDKKMKLYCYIQL